MLICRRPLGPCRDEVKVCHDSQHLMSVYDKAYHHHMLISSRYSDFVSRSGKLKKKDSSNNGLRVPLQPFQK